jgi:hypothetical protein
MTNRLAIVEVVRALAVLALVCLNFAHAPLASASPHGGWAAVDSASYCGEPLEDGSTQHAPCHACRIGGGADLPPPCPAIAPRLEAGALDHAVSISPPPARSVPGRIFARGPPVA